MLKHEDYGLFLQIEDFIALEEADRIKAKRKLYKARRIHTRKELVKERKLKNSPYLCRLHNERSKLSGGIESLKIDRRTYNIDINDPEIHLQVSLRNVLSHLIIEVEKNEEDQREKELGNGSYFKKSSYLKLVYKERRKLMDRILLLNKFSNAYNYAEIEHGISRHKALTDLIKETKQKEEELEAELREKENEQFWKQHSNFSELVCDKIMQMCMNS